MTQTVKSAGTFHLHCVTVRFYYLFLFLFNDSMQYLTFCGVALLHCGIVLLYCRVVVLMVVRIGIGVVVFALVFLLFVVVCVVVVVVVVVAAAAAAVSLVSRNLMNSSCCIKLNHYPFLLCFSNFLLRLCLSLSC